MSILSSVLNNPKKLLSPRKIFQAFLGRLFPFWMRVSSWVPSDRVYIKVFYYLAMHEKLDLNAPKTYTQKIQWLKLYNTNPLYSKMVDKYGVREIIKQELGDEYLIPLLGVWDSFEKIDFGILPDQFVLKTTHDSGSVIFCRDKCSFDQVAAGKRLSKALKTNYFYKSREYPYRNVKPRIVAEQYMHDENHLDLTDYKFFCFNGEPRFLQLTANKAAVKTVGYFDMKFREMPFNTGHSESEPDLFQKPDDFKKMVEVARRLSKNITHVRIDLYYINKRIYFGEYTFHHNGGIVTFSPPEWDMKIGGMISLPQIPAQA